MTPHMGQGAATSIEDGAFLAKVFAKIVSGHISLVQGIDIYEKRRMPLAHFKQQISFLNGQIWMLPDGPLQQARDEALKPELRGEVPLYTPNLWTDPFTALTVFGYDVERDAELAIRSYLDGQEPRDHQSGLTTREMERVFGSFWPTGVPMTPTPSARL
jgi:salicylate hydroxylase